MIFTQNMQVVEIPGFLDNPCLAQQNLQLQQAFQKDMLNCLNQFKNSYSMNANKITDNLAVQQASHNHLQYNFNQLYVQKNSCDNDLITEDNYLKNQNLTLRGGGCGHSRPIVKMNHPNEVNKDKSVINFKNKIQSDFLSQLEACLTTIVEKANLVSDEEILLSFQWFIAMKENFNILCLDEKAALTSIDLILKTFPQLLKSVNTYLRSSGVFCLQVLQICNELAKVMFSFFLKNNDRFLKVEEKQVLLDLVADFETQLKIEASNIWVAGAEFEIEMLKAVIQSSPSNSDEGQKLFISFMGGLIKSLLTMSPTDDLVDTFVEGAKFLHKAYKVNNLKKKYEIYYYFESLKWQILNSLKQGLSVKKTVQLLSEAYQKNIKDSSDWLLNFCWVRMISFLLQYSPIISKQETNQQIWEVLTYKKYINLMSFDKNYGRLTLKSNCSQVPHEVNQLLLRYKQLEQFQATLLTILKSSSKKSFILNNDNQFIASREDFFYSALQEEINQEEFIEQNQNIEDLEAQVTMFKKEFLHINKLSIKGQQKQLGHQIKDNINQLINRVFGIYYWIDKIQIIIYITTQRFRVIAESIVNQLVISEFLSDLKKIEDEYKEKYIIVCSQLQDEKSEIIQNFISLQFRLKTLIIQKNAQEDDIKSMTDQLLNIENFINRHKQCNRALLDITKNFQQVLKHHGKNYKKTTNLRFSHQSPINFITTTAISINNSNHLQGQIQKIQKLLSQVEIKVQQYSLVNYLLNDIIELMQMHKERLEKIQNFLEHYLDYVEPEQQISQDKGVYQLLMKIEKFFQDEKNNHGVEQNKLHQLNSELQANKLILKSQEQKSENHAKEILFSISVIEQLLIQYEKTPDKISLIKEQIEQIHQKLNQYQQTEQQEPEHQQGQQTIFVKEFNSNNELSQQILNLDQSIEHCRSIFSQISENLSFQKKVWKLSITINSQDSARYTNMFENDTTQKISTHLQFLLNQNFYLKNLSICKFEQPKSCELMLVFLEEIHRTTLTQRQPNTGILLKMQKVQNKVKELFEDENYKVRQCYVISLLTIQQMEPKLNQFCQDNIVQLWAIEKDERVKSFLKNKEIIDMQKKLFSSDIRSFSQRLQMEMQEKFNRMNDLEQKVNLEGDTQIRQQLQKELQKQNQDLEEYVDNVSDMAAQLNMSLQFLKEIRKQLVIIKQKIDKLQDSINQIGDDVRKLRGKSFMELFEIRKRKVLEFKQLRDLNSIYIQLIVQEWDPVTGNKAQESVLLADEFEDSNGEVNEFLQKELQMKDVMLLRGFAGSGKSRAAGKIEEFLWEKKDSKSSPWIPIYVSLPSLKEPKFNLIDQALESEYYQFDKIQVREFKEAMANKSLQVILILDSYDEMKLECIQANLFQTNRMALDLLGENSKSVKEHLKLIITTRTEILTQNSYQTWFYGESLQSLKEIELLGFDDNQQQEYLNEYTLLSVKKELFELYEFVKQVTKEKMDLHEFTNFWRKIQFYLKSRANQNDDLIMTEQQATEIINIIKEEKCFKNISKDQTVNLHKKLIALWSKQKFDKLIQNVNIKHIMTSPFMMEIVVQVLPNMTKKYSDASVFKETFIENFIRIKKQTVIEKQMILEYENQGKKLRGLIPNLDKMQDISQDSLKKSVHHLWDQLEEQKVFMNQSLADKIDEKNLQHIDEVEIVIRALVVKKFTVFDFYFSFIEFFHQRQIRKLMELGKSVNYDSLMIDLFNFSQSLALDLTIHESTQVKYNAKGQLELKFIKKPETEKDWQDEYFNDFVQNGEYKKLIRSCILLTQKGSNHSFTHKSIQEFYVAYYLLKIFENINKVQKEDFEIICDQCLWENGKLTKKENFSTSQKNSLQLVQQICDNMIDELYNKDEFNISTDNFKGVLSLIKEEMKSRLDMRDKLIQLVHLSKTDSCFIRAASNSIYLLSYNNEYLGDQQMQNIRLSNTKLLGMSFYGTNLNGSFMKDVKIISCNFNCAILTNVKWLKMDCNELPYLKGHHQDTNCVVFSPDQSTLASCSTDKTIKLWDYKQGKELASLTGHSNNTIAYSPDGKVLASGGNDSKVILWDIDKKSEIVALSNHAEMVTSVKFSPDGTILASGSKDTTVRLWNVQQQAQICLLEGKAGPVQCVAFSPDAKLLLSCSSKIIQLWDLEQKNLLDTLVGHTQQVNSVVISPDGQMILSGSHDTTIRLWSVKTRKELAILKGHTANVYQVAFSPDGQTFASSSFDQTIRLWDTKAGKEITKFQGHTGVIFCVTYSFDGQTLASCGQDSIVRLWDFKAGQETLSLDGHTDEVLCVAFSPEGLRIASGSSDSTIRIWNVEGGKEISVLRGHKGDINYIQFSPDGQLLASAGQDSTIRLWNMISGKEDYILKGHAGQVNFLSFSCQTLASCGNDRKIVLWNYSDRKQILILNGHENYVLSVVFSPDGLMLASGSSDKSVRLWDTQTGNLISILMGHSEKINCVAFSPDGTILASGGPDSHNVTIKIWDVKTKTEIKALKGHCTNKYLAFSPNGQILASCSWESTVRTIRFWDVSTWADLTTLEGHTGKVQQAIFSPNGKTLASCSLDNTIRLWDLGVEFGNSFQYDFKITKPECFKIIGRQPSIVAKKCQLQGTQMITKSDWNLQKLFQQKQ